MSGKQNIINGFRKHFSNLAVPIFDPDFNYKSSDINDYEIDIITELTTQEDIPEPTYETKISHSYFSAIYSSKLLLTSFSMFY
jgi:hypothetical protein